MAKEYDHREDIGISTPKSKFSEWFSEVIAKAELADLRYNVKGFVVFRPWAVLCMDEMFKFLERELQRKGHEPALFPAVIPESNFKKEAEHVEEFAPEVFWVTHGGSGKLEERLAMRPTSETAMYNMYSIWIRSWRDLPLKIYQRCQVWRHETKATRPFIRSREFHWIEAHDAFATKQEAEKQVLEDMDTTERIMHQKFGIPFIFFKRPEWDKFPGAVHTFAADSLMPDGKIIQQPSTHLLGQNFSKPFGIKFKDKDEKEAYVWQTCYGPAVSRIIASVVAVHGDDKGLVFPYSIAPVQVVIVPINSSTEKECKKIKERLFSSGLRVRVDDSDNNPGWKFNQWEMKGVPIRLEVGPREIKDKVVTAVRRDTGEKKTLKIAGLEASLQKLGDSMDKSLRQKADKWFSSMIHSAKTMEELESGLKKGGFVKVNFCSMKNNGIECAEKLKEALHADVRGERFDKKERPAGKCISCGKNANSVVYVGKQY